MQAARPTGLVGTLFGYIMAIANREESIGAMERLKLSATDNILETGFGPGDLIARMASVAKWGTLPELILRKRWSRWRVVGTKHQLQRASSTSELVTSRGFLSKPSGSIRSSPCIHSNSGRIPSAT